MHAYRNGYEAPITVERVNGELELTIGEEAFDLRFDQALELVDRINQLVYEH